MKKTGKIFVMYLVGICFGRVLYAQAPSKTSVSKKHDLSVKHNANRNTYHKQTSLLQGVWSDKSENNAIFWIEGKRVFFFDHIGDTENEKKNLTYWSVFNNKLSFHYSGGLVVTDNIIKLTRDSLILYRRDKEASVAGYSRYVKLK